MQAYEDFLRSTGAGAKKPSSLYEEFLEQHKAEAPVAPTESYADRPHAQGASRTWDDALPTPRIAATPADALGSPRPVAHPSSLPGGAVTNAIMDYAVEPMMRSPVQSSLATAAMMTPPGAMVGLGLAGKDVAEYGAQKMAERSLPPDVRAMAEKDPERIPGAAVAVEAGMLAAPMAAHMGARAVPKIMGKLGDVSEGVVEAGARGAGAEIRGMARDMGAQQRLIDRAKYDRKLKDLQEAFAPKTQTYGPLLTEARAPQEAANADAAWWNQNQPPEQVQATFEKAQQKTLPRGAMATPVPSQEFRRAARMGSRDPELVGRTDRAPDLPETRVYDLFERAQRDQSGHAYGKPDENAPTYTAHGWPEPKTPAWVGRPPAERLQLEPGKTIEQRISEYLNSDEVKAARARSDAHAEIDPAAPERDGFREHALNTIYGEGAPRKEKRIDIILGHPGAGKTAVFTDRLTREHGSLVLDADRVKQMAPEYDEGYGANALHKESVEVRAQALERAVENGDNIVFPTVGDPVMTVDMVRGLNEAGYKVHVHLADVPPDIAAERVMSGVKDGTRHFRDPQGILDKADDPIKAYEALKSEPGVFTYARYDNNVPKGHEPIPVENGNGPGRPEDVRAPGAQPNGTGLGEAGSFLGDRSAQAGERPPEGRPALTVRDAAGRLRRDLTKVSDGELQQEATRLAEQSGAEEGLYRSVQESAYRSDYQDLPRTERLGAKGQEDLPDADGAMDPDVLAGHNKIVSDYNKSTLGRSSRAKALDRINTELQRRGLELHANPIAPAVQLGAKVARAAVKWVSEIPPVAKLTDAFNSIVDPAARSADAGKTAGILRTATGRMAGTYERAATLVEQARAAFNKAPIPDQIAFMDRMEHGLPQPTPELTAAAKSVRKILDTTRDEIRSLGTGALDDFIVDYFPHIWKDPTKAEGIFAQAFGKRPLEGSKAFLKERTIPTIAEGIAKGLEPVSTNPVDLTLLKLREMQRYHMAHSVLRELDGQGLVRFVASGTRAPEGYIRINDKVARVLGKGEYWAPEPAAQILNNYLSPGLRGNAIYDSIRWSGNALNMAQLGLSAFHLGFTSLDAIVSRVALGVERGKAGQIGALGEFASALATPVTNPIHGARVKRAYLTGKGSTDALQIAGWVERAGGRVKMDSFYKNSAPERLVENIRRARVQLSKGEYRGAAWSGTKAGLGSIPAVLETVSKPIMEWVVPAQKLGVFADLAKFHMEQLGPNATVAEQNAVLQRVWNSVDNRMGQLVYDNLFWNKTFKDLSMAGVRSVGWNLGTVRELGGGMGDIVREGSKGLAGEGGELTSRAAYVIALPLTVGMMGAVINYLATGQPPQTLKDYYYPRTGTMDADGNEDRIVLPSYMKDLIPYAGSPWQTVKHKMAPQLSLIGEMLNNEDFYGDMIRNPDDPLVQQAKDEAEYVAKAMRPFSLTNMLETGKRGDESALGRYGPWVGVTPAPRKIVRSDAQNAMAGYLAQRRVTGATPEDAEARRSRSEILSSMRGGKGDLGDEVSSALERGQLTPPQFSKLLKRAGTTPAREQFQRLTMPQALDVYNKADDRERALFFDLLNRKISNASRTGTNP